MPIGLWFFFIIGFLQAAPPSEQFIPVDKKAQQPSITQSQLLEENSLERGSPPFKAKMSPLWPLSTRLDLSTGLLIDDRGFSSVWLEHVYAQAGLRLFVQPTYRWSLQTLFWPQQALFISGNFEWTPSRDQLRPYYGIGAAHRLINQTRLTSFIETERYYANLQVGLEYLNDQNAAYFVELKGWVGGSAPLFQLNLGYSFALD